LAAITLTGTFITDFADMVARWSAWARDTVAAWPDDGSRPSPDWDVRSEIAARDVPPARLPGGND
jgi:hypothetical protein